MTPDDTIFRIFKILQFVNTTKIYKRSSQGSRWHRSTTVAMTPYHLLSARSFGPCAMTMFALEASFVSGKKNFINIMDVSIRSNANAQMINNHTGAETRRLIRWVPLSSDYTGWIRLNIGPAVNTWMRQHQTSAILEVTVTEPRRHLVFDPLQFIEPQDCSNQPSG